ncbi:hypothetical protein LshimejAT787_0506950 [Lyophyllum shimeji]|uniref:Uncharacterized protein n=1 Tax=Lyophyllum shimeji TaxID=47721 RepID=A0A9P3UPB8_LYOSH|nr:hypothetical protein LshimejAT787_0506950 [Lyophyllum shimeji]
MDSMNAADLKHCIKAQKGRSLGGLDADDLDLFKHLLPREHKEIRRQSQPFHSRQLTDKFTLTSPQTPAGTSVT